MVYIVIESPILATHIHNHVKVDRSKVCFICTGGFVYKYRRDRNTDVEVSINNIQTYKTLKYYAEHLKPQDIVIIATDHDPAGALIALEVLSIFPNALRYKNRIDDILYENTLVVERFLKNSGKEFFSEPMAMAYLQERLSGEGIRDEKIKILEYILAHDDENLLVIPEKYAEIITEL